MENEQLLSSSSHSNYDKRKVKVTFVDPVSSPCSCLKSNYKIFTGFGLVILIAVSWTGSTQFSKSTFSPTFHAPFFVLWFGTCFQVIIYPLFLLPYLFNRSPIKTFLRSAAALFIDNEDDERTVLHGLVLYILKYVIPFCVLFLLTNYLYLLSLNYLLPGTVTAVFSSCACSFVYILSVIFLKDKVLLFRIVAIFFAVAGVIFMGYSEGLDGDTSFKGIVLVISAALGSALYQVLFKRIIGDATGPQVALFLTLIGLINMLIFWTIFLFLHYMEFEVINWKEIPWINVNGSALLGLVFNFLVNFGISVTFPLFISIGILVGLPLNAVADTLFFGKVFGVYKSVSLVSILIGFMLMLIPTNRLSQFERNFKCSQDNVTDDTGRSENTY